MVSNTSYYKNRITIVITNNIYKNKNLSIAYNDIDNILSFLSLLYNEGTFFNEWT